MELSIERIEVLLLIAAVVAMLTRRVRLPYTVGLVAAGAFLVATHTAPEMALTRDLIYTAFLPPLIFEAAFQIPWGPLRQDAGVLLALAVPGVLIAAAVTATGMHLLAGWGWSFAILFGVLIAATDPVSVIATFKELGVGGRTRLLVESESLLNDGTVAVFFGLALAAMAGGAVGPLAAARAFALTVAGGIAVGGIIGGALMLLAGRTTDRFIELTLTSVVAYGSFIAAEHFGFSGVLATLTAGMLLGNIGTRGAISPRGREAVEAFWEYVAFVVNSLIFLLMGIRLAHEHYHGVALSLLVGIVFVNLGRAVSVYGIAALFSHSGQRVSRRDQHVLFWGGLRGALALALVLGLPPSTPGRNALVSVAFGVVAWSVVVHGLTMPILLRRLGLAPQEERHHAR